MDSSDNPVAGWMLFLLFIVINSIFYGFGSAIQNLNENEIEDKAEQGDRKSKLLLHIMNAPGSLISRSSAMSNGASLAPQEIKILFAVFPAASLYFLY